MKPRRMRVGFVVISRRLSRHVAEIEAGPVRSTGGDRVDRAVLRGGRHLAPGAVAMLIVRPIAPTSGWRQHTGDAGQSQELWALPWFLAHLPSRIRPPPRTPWAGRKNRSRSAARRSRIHRSCPRTRADQTRILRLQSARQVRVWRKAPNRQRSRQRRAVVCRAADALA